MTTLEILSIHRILTEENKRASEENKIIVDKAYSKTETVEKMDIRASYEKLKQSYDALVAFEKHEWK